MCFSEQKLLKTSLLPCPLVHLHTGMLLSINENNVWPHNWSYQFPDQNNKSNQKQVDNGHKTIQFWSRKNPEKITKTWKTITPIIWSRSRLTNTENATHNGLPLTVQPAGHPWSSYGQNTRQTLAGL